jgi:hypothetical protein
MEKELGTGNSATTNNQDGSETQNNALSKSYAITSSSTMNHGNSSAKLNNIEEIRLGRYRIKVWYSAPYPEEYTKGKVLYLCEFCLKYMSSVFVAERHAKKCPHRFPPGNEIYRDHENRSVFEVDGKRAKVIYMFMLFCTSNWMPFSLS